MNIPIVGVNWLAHFLETTAKIVQISQIVNYGILMASDIYLLT